MMHRALAVLRAAAQLHAGPGGRRLMSAVHGYDRGRRMSSRGQQRGILGEDQAGKGEKTCKDRQPAEPPGQADA